MRLWPHQLKAIETAGEYLQCNASGSTLVRMPTGTGKTGIMAILSQFITSGSVLIIVPWTSLRTQLVNEIRSEFWKKIESNRKTIPKEVEQFTPSNISAILKKSKGKQTVYICTIQSIDTIYRCQESDFFALEKEIELVLFDEGHRKPAPQWARAIRALAKPTILFTATPYRNDHKMFDINSEFVFALSYDSALKNQYVRKVIFHPKVWDSAEEFVRIVRDFYHSDFKKIKPVVPDAKIIIRCETVGEVNEIANLLKYAGESVLAIHDCFRISDGIHYRSVPTSDKNNAVFWVHQNKLVEGIDNPSLCILAIYKPFKNARSLVQQIGRITRNPRRLAGQSAHVLSREEDGQSVYWQKYLAYEKYCEKNPKLYKTESVYDLGMKMQDMHVYFERDFRTRFNIDASDIHKHFRYRLSAYCYKNTKNISLEEIREAIEDEYAKSDLQIRNVVRPDSTTVVFPYIKYENSPVLLDESYIELTLGYVICKAIEPYVFFFDSNGKSCDFLAKNMDQINPESMQSLFEGKKAKITEMTLLNSDLGRHSIRRRTIDAVSIVDTAPALSDFAYIPSTSRGLTTSNRKTIRRYLGFSRGRISDISRAEIRYSDYIGWLRSIVERLNTNGKAHPVFERYAGIAEPPMDVHATGILLDVSNISEYFETINNTNGKRESLNIEDTFSEVKDGDFYVQANSNKYRIRINYDPNSGHFKLTSPELELAYARKMAVADEIQDNVIQLLNHEQSFRVSVDAPGLIYANGHFYKSRLFGGRPSESLDILKVLVPVEKLGQIVEEKGKPKPDGTGWKEDSLFDLIDNCGQGTEIGEYMEKVDILVCDDLNKEIADFIAASTVDKRVIFLHAKASKKGHKASASALSIVCAQASKNLSHIHPMTDSKPPNIARWKKPWKEDGLPVNNRIRRGNPDPYKLWNQINEIIKDPTASREVWILLGNELSREHFDNDRKSTRPSPEIIQILYLLSTTWHAVSEIGAKLRIFCSP
jgi:superfamily II DNA or RNA helicase